MGLIVKINRVKILLIYIWAQFWPLHTLADRYGIDDAIDGGGAGLGLKYVFWGAVVGAGIGYFYSVDYNSRHEEKFATDGCVIVGAFLGMFIFPFVYIFATK